MESISQKKKNSKSRLRMCELIFYNNYHCQESTRCDVSYVMLNGQITERSNK